MKTIKRERQVRLDELVGYITKNEVVSSHFRSNRGSDVIVDINGGFDFFGTFNGNDLFTITEEVEITEETKLNVYEIYHYGNNSFNATTHFNISVNRVLNMGMKESLFIYLQNEDGSIGELIWDKERGLID